MGVELLRLLGAIPTTKAWGFHDVQGEAFGPEDVDGDSGNSFLRVGRGTGFLFIL